MIERLEPNEMGVTEARKLLGVTPQTIRNWAREGRFPILRGGGDMDTPIILDRVLVLDYARLRGKLDESQVGDAPAPEPVEPECDEALDDGYCAIPPPRQFKKDGSLCADYMSKVRTNRYFETWRRNPGAVDKPGEWPPQRNTWLRFHNVIRILEDAVVERALRRWFGVELGKREGDAVSCFVAVVESVLKQIDEDKPEEGSVTRLEAWQEDMRQRMYHDQRVADEPGEG